MVRVAKKAVIFKVSLNLDYKSLIVLLITLAVLGACSNNYHRAPVEALLQPPSEKVSTHTVAPGETLYAIAWRYDLDYGSLARANGIQTPYTILPGQVLDLTGDPRIPWHARKPQKQKGSGKPKAAAVKPGRSIKKTFPSKKKPASVSGSTSPKWQWPLKGKVLKPFRVNDPLQKGIDIHGHLGEPVLAASAGRVVYAGDGLRGYGKLLIVKHNEKYLSAYAHNRRLLVGEGDLVKGGNKIAEVGSTGAVSVKLYFEIRFNGKPVDPLWYLPQP